MTKTEDLMKIMRAYMDGNDVQVRRMGYKDVWVTFNKASCPDAYWDSDKEYRIAPRQPKGTIGKESCVSKIEPDNEKANIKPDSNRKNKSNKRRRMTNRELADLMATGKVEKCYPYYVDGHDVSRVYQTHSYYRAGADRPCAKSIRIRYRDTDEWFEPFIEKDNENT